MSEELELLKEVAGRLDKAGIPYMVSGSVAMNYYAQPRMTRDIDIVIELKDKDVGKFTALFESGYYVEGETIKDEVKRQGMFNIIHNKFIIKVDFIIQKDGEYDRVAFERRREITVDGTPIYVISQEDLILRKLWWSKDSGSELQMRDVKNLLETSTSLDLPYMEKWAGVLGIQEAYQRMVE